ncbi:MAG: YitT family protein [Burkholderiales bacterium]|nr:YitT family protein [Burkholderiales bacterium]
MLISFGVVLMAAAGLLTGGAPGIAFLLHYATGWPLGGLFMAVNLPFYLLALRVFGVRFTLTSALAAALVSALIDLVPGWLGISRVHPAYAAVFGGLAIGAGLLMLFRHQTSLGGLNVLALWLHRRLGWPAGRVQMVMDCTLVLAAWFVTDTERVAWSVLGAVALNLVLAFNHKPGRYLGL